MFKTVILSALFLIPNFLFSQGNFTGNIETTFQYLNPDSIIGANQPPSKGLLN